MGLFVFYWGYSRLSPFISLYFYTARLILPAVYQRTSPVERWDRSQRRTDDTVVSADKQLKKSHHNHWKVQFNALCISLFSSLVWFNAIFFLQFFFPHPNGVVDKRSKFPARTAEREQGRKIAAVVNSRRVGGAGHPEILIDGGRGDNVTVHCWHSPVPIGKGDPDHQPSQEAQEEGKRFHDGIHNSTIALDPGCLFRTFPTDFWQMSPG